MSLGFAALMQGFKPQNGIGGSFQQNNTLCSVQNSNKIKNHFIFLFHFQKGSQEIVKNIKLVVGVNVIHLVIIPLTKCKKKKN